MDIVLSKEALRVAKVIYGEYMARRKSDIPAYRTREFTSDDLEKKLFSDMDKHNLSDILQSLTRQFHIKLDVLGGLTLSDEFIAFMEQRSTGILQKWYDNITKLIP